MLTQTDARNNVTTFEYNVMNKLKKRYDNGGVGVAAKTEKYTYNANGLLGTKTDRNGDVTTYDYYGSGKLKSQTVGTISITYGYDGNGNQTSIADATGTTNRIYDELNLSLIHI